MWWLEFNSHNLHTRRRELTLTKLSSDLHLYAVAHECTYAYLHTTNKCLYIFKEINLKSPLGQKWKVKGLTSTGNRRQGCWNPSSSYHSTSCWWYEHCMCLEGKSSVSTGLLSVPTWNITFKNQLITTCLLFWHLEQGHKCSHSQLQIGLLRLWHSSPVPGSIGAAGHSPEDAMVY